MDYDNIDVDKMLRFDALAEAGKLTKESYKTDEHTMQLGMALHLEHVQYKRAILEAQGDTTMSSNMDLQLALLKANGFIELYRENTEAETKYSDGPVIYHETMYVHWHPTEKILHVCETYNETSVNSAKMYYCIKGNFKEISPITSSGGFDRIDDDSGIGYWQGNHDTREAFQHKLNQIRSVGKLVDWTREDPFLWLIPYTRKNEDYEEVNRKVLSSFPEEVLKAMNIGIGDER